MWNLNIKSFLIIFAGTRRIILLLLAGHLISTSLIACTVFCFQGGDQVIVAKNYDWMLDDGLVVINKRDVAKTALLSITKEKPAKWVSKYGSVTFNQYGREFPLGGMNEKGLVIEVLVNFDTLYPQADQRPAVDILAWTQYCLDTCGSVKEVLDNQKNIRVSPQFYVPLHFMVCDPNNSAVAVEFINGKTVTSSMDTVPARIMTNSGYQNCLAWLGQHVGFGGNKAIPDNFSENPDDRFIIIADHIQKYLSGSAFDNRKNLLFCIKELETVRFNHTQWQIVYDLTYRKIHFRLRRRQPLRWRTIDCNVFSYQCDTPVKILDVQKPLAGDVTENFITYTTDLNRKLVFHTLKNTPVTKFASDNIINQIADYPESLSCQPSR